MQIWRNDRFGRGGDHTEFLNAGFPAVRLSVAIENYNWQHQDLRTENGIKYGDTIENMDFPYLARVTKLNVAALAWLASAPPPPEPTVDGAVSTDTKVSWPVLNGVEAHRIHWRRTDVANWQNSTDGGNGISVIGCTPNCPEAHADRVKVLKGIRVDDWVFGVSSVSKDGFESPVASAVPGGAFKPYVAPPPAQ